VPRPLWLFLLGTVLLLLPGSTPAAQAGDVSGSEFSRLVTEAPDNPAALAVLTGVTSVDGVPVDMATVLDGSPADQASRLKSLARLTGAPDSGLDGDSVRAQAEDIISKPPFSAKAASSDDLLSRVFAFIGDILDNPAGRGIGLVVIALIALLAGYLALNRMVTRRWVPESAPGSIAVVPEDYRTQADTAEASGDFAAAVRLLFIDGTHRLERLHAVRDADVASTATVRPLAGDNRFLDRFDEIAYGGAAAQRDDVAAARRGWDALARRLESG
jgi:hypothetical protein